MFNPKYVLTGFRNYQIPFQDKNVLDQQLTLPAFTCSQLVPTLLTILSLPTSQFRQSVGGKKSSQDRQLTINAPEPKYKLN